MDAHDIGNGLLDYYKLHARNHLFLYNIAKYSFGNFGFHLLMLTPITLLIKLINNRHQK